jgi:diguanylate cyclase (GGDEF)-like protein
MVSGPRVGSVVRLFASNMMGRSRQSDIRIDDPTVSRRHARIVRDDERGYLLQDLGSRNGTLVRGRPITRCRLIDGDWIGVGPVIFRFSGEPRRVEPRTQLRDIDTLTGALGREPFDDRLVAELAHAKRTHSDLWLLLLGVDDHDRWGPEAGDAALRQLAATVDEVLRAGDVLARYGGGAEFAILARDAENRDPLALAERIRNRVEKTPFVHETTPMTLTVSVGVAALADCEEPSVDQLVRMADAGLHAAKISGRNCCKRFPSA